MFWLKFVLFALIVFILISVIKHFLRKVLKIEKVKRGFFSNQYINDRHRRIDWGIRAVTVLTFIIFILISIYEDISYIMQDISINSIFMVISIYLLMADCLVRAYFEWRHTPNPKQSILTLSEMLLLVIAIIFFFQTMLSV